MENRTEQSHVSDREGTEFKSPEGVEVLPVISESLFSNMGKSVDAVEVLKREEERPFTVESFKEFAKSCNLTMEETQSILEERGFIDRLNNLQNKSIAVCDNFIARVRKIGKIATTAVLLSVAAPTPTYSTDQVVEVTHFEQSSLPKYDAIMAELHKSVLTDKVERAMVSVRDKDGSYRFVAITDGKGTSASIPDEAIALIKNGKEVETVHTHPLEAYTFAGVMSSSEIAQAREGKFRPRVVPPSGDADFVSMIQQDVIAQKSGAKVHNKIIDAGGEWSYEIKDRNSPFIKMMVKMQEVFVNEFMNIKFSPEEDSYRFALAKESFDPRFILAQIKARSGKGDTIADTLAKKLQVIEDKINNIKLSKEEHVSFQAFLEYSRGPLNIFAVSDIDAKNDLAVQFYTHTASKLGILLKYTPNDVKQE